MKLLVLRVWGGDGQKKDPQLRLSQNELCYLFTCGSTVVCSSTTQRGHRTHCRRSNFMRLLCGNRIPCTACRGWHRSFGTEWHVPATPSCSGTRPGLPGQRRGIPARPHRPRRQQDAREALHGALSAVCPRQARCCMNMTSQACLQRMSNHTQYELVQPDTTFLRLQLLLLCPETCLCSKQHETVIDINQKDLGVHGYFVS